MTFLTKRRALGALVLPLLALAACGGSSGGGGSSSSGTSATTPDAAAVALVPAAVKSKGTLKVASDATYAPDEFIASDGHTVVGFDADLMAAIGQVLGLHVDLVNATFSSIIPGLQSGKYDVGISSATDTKDREQTVDFVTYFSSGSAFFVNANGGPNITSLDGLCGHKAAVESGTTEQTDAQGQQQACTSAGKPALTVDVYPDQNATNLAVSSGHDDVSLADTQVADYQVKQSNGQFKRTGTYGSAAIYGIELPKGNGMAQAVLAAVKDLIANGTYKQILDKWGVSAGAINNPGVNQANS